MSLKTERGESLTWSGTKLLHVETTDETKDEIRLYGQMVYKKGHNYTRVWEVTTKYPLRKYTVTN